MSPRADPPLAPDTGAEAAPRTAWRAGEPTAGFRTVPLEAPVALVHDGVVSAIALATPQDLEDFALGFSLNQAIVERPEQVQAIEVVETPEGFEARTWLHQSAAPNAEHSVTERLAATVRPLKPVVGRLEMHWSQVQEAVRLLAEAQVIGRSTQAVHAAGFWSPHYAGLAAVREDVGALNALDKLAGAMARRRLKRPGAVVISGRISVEAVRKTAAIGAPVLIAISAPTDLAIQTAEACDITLCAMARGDGFEVFTRPDRILP